MWFEADQTWGQRGWGRSTRWTAEIQGRVFQSRAPEGALTAASHDDILCPVEWTAHCPDSDCPPETALPAVGHIYRMVAADPPKEDDFRSYAELKPEDWAGHCQACGLSVYRTWEDVAQARKLPFLRKMRVALALLDVPNGLLLNTPSKKTGEGHHTWWPEDGFDPLNAFEVVEDAA